MLSLDSWVMHQKPGWFVWQNGIMNQLCMTKQYFGIYISMHILSINYTPIVFLKQVSYFSMPQLVISCNVASGNDPQNLMNPSSAVI